VLDETQYLPFIRALAVAIKAPVVHGDAPYCQPQPNRLFQDACVGDCGIG
jgi:hypothetical protein